MANIDVTVVVPARDEVDAVEELVEGVGQVLAGRAFEVIVIDDASTDGTTQKVKALADRHDWVRWLRNDVSSGKSAAIRSALRIARGTFVVTIDADGQNPPEHIPALLKPMEEGAPTIGIVQGQRVGRGDTAARRVASRMANRLRGWLLKDGVRDSGCGYAAFRREAYFDLPWFSNIHRFMPAMMLREGWEVRTVPVTHKDRIGGQSKYSNLGRALVGIPDLLGAAWLIRRKGPGRFGRK